MKFKNYMIFIILTGLQMGGLFAAESKQEPLDRPVDLDDRLIPDISAELYPELIKFIKRYRCSAELEKMADEKSKTSWGTIADDSYYVKLHGSYGGYDIKSQAFDRIINAKRLQRCIDIHNLDCLGVSQKYLAWSNNYKGYFPRWLIVAKTIQENVPDDFFDSSIFPLSLKEVQQLVIVAKNTGFTDWFFEGKYNILRNSEKKLIFIDTESKSFGSQRKNPIVRLHEYAQEKYMEASAIVYLNDQLKLIEQDDDQIIPIYERSDLDDLCDDIDFAKVQAEYQAHFNALEEEEQRLKREKRAKDAELMCMARHDTSKYAQKQIERAQRLSIVNNIFLYIARQVSYYGYCDAINSVSAIVQQKLDKENEKN